MFASDASSSADLMPLISMVLLMAINKTMEISGMRSALDDASEANMLLETTDYDEKTEFYDILKKEGIKSALEWRRSLVFGKGD